MSTESETSTPQQVTPTALAAAYQITARWYSNDAQLIWRRVGLFVTLNTALLTAEVFASHLQLIVRAALPMLGAVFCFYWYQLMRRAWLYQDFQLAMLREQEDALGLGPLGAFTRVASVRAQTAEVTVGDTPFSSRQLKSGFRHRTLANAIIWIYVCLHSSLFICAVAGISLASTAVSKIP